MRAQTEVESLIFHKYRELGYDPADLIQIKPKDGGWNDALSYEITRKDGKRTLIYRRDLDDENEQEITNTLKSFE